MNQKNYFRDKLREVPDEKLEALLNTFGIVREYIDFSGNLVQTPLDERLAVLAAMGVTVDSQEGVDDLLAARNSPAGARWMDEVLVIRPGQFHGRLVSQESEADKHINWQLTLEDGQQLAGDFMLRDLEVVEDFHADGTQSLVRHFPLPELPLGYHDLSLDDGERRLESFLIVAPDRCHESQWLRDNRRIWGVSVQLYSLSSEHNWGIGDFRDLRDMITCLAGQGADFILLNPLHALDIKNPENASPYSPTDRRFLNPLYINPSIEDDYLESPDVRQWVLQAAFEDKLAKLRRGDTVDYSEVFALKYRVFDLMYGHFRQRHLEQGSSAGEAFRDYVRSQNKTILDFADFQAGFTLKGVSSCHDPEFHLYLQWLVVRQLTRCQDLAREQGMRLGLIRDLAVGGNSESCEVITNPELFCQDARIGAPPDNFNPNGQNWGLPPIRPDVLKESRFSHFITLLRENMTDCGGLRIDHVMGLLRLWWCPADREDVAGAYVAYPVDELFAILRLESQRARCVVIGEDLGLVPPEIRSHIYDSAVLSNVIFYFEKYDGWHFKKPGDYPQRALAIVANHDVPTLKAWWNTNDLILRRELGLTESTEQYEQDKSYRDHEKRQVLYWLDEAGVLPSDWADKQTDRDFDESLCRAIFKGCAASRSLLVSVQLDDIAGLETPVNIPGTHTEYANWRRKITVPLRELCESNVTRHLLSGIREERP